MSRGVFIFDLDFVNKMSMRCFIETTDAQQNKLSPINRVLISFFSQHLKGHSFVTAFYCRAGTFADGTVAGKYLFINPTCLGTILELTSIQQTVWIHAKPFPKVLLKATAHWRRRRGGLASSAAVHFRGSWLARHSLLNRAKEGPRGLKRAK